MAFDTPATHLMYYDALKPHIMRHMNLDQVINLQRGVDQTLVNSSFVDKFKLATNPLWIKNVVLADEHHIAVTKETAPFSVMLENLHSTIQGPIIIFPKFDIILGLDWLQKNNPHIDWVTSVLTIKCEGINHQIYPDSVD
ncbi:hypothetical protein DSO57_1016611 [Entomophthora muscae]|uniref:Uncharacterized protein n=1 Tax=Entomophthora muscae TaxID=34485 RepID=A0ACC2SHH9_9FUNG|nr:hypothetical protein DSO57_1016611 [Entomophthora muscae]